jgi:hypothetical protein
MQISVSLWTLAKACPIQKLVSAVPFADFVPSANENTATVHPSGAFNS